MITRARKKGQEQQLQPIAAAALESMEEGSNARPSAEDVEREQEAEQVPAAPVSRPPTLTSRHTSGSQARRQREKKEAERKEQGEVADAEEEQGQEQDTAAPPSHQSDPYRRHTHWSLLRREEEEEAARQEQEQEHAEAGGQPSRASSPVPADRPQTRAFQRQMQQNAELVRARELGRDFSRQKPESAARGQESPAAAEEEEEDSESEVSEQEEQSKSQLSMQKLRRKTQMKVPWRQQQQIRRAAEEQDSDENEESPSDSPGPHGRKASGLPTGQHQQTPLRNKPSIAKGIKRSIEKITSSLAGRKAAKTQKSSQKSTREATTTAANPEAAQDQSIGDHNPSHPAPRPQIFSTRHPIPVTLPALTPLFFTLQPRPLYDPSTRQTPPPILHSLYFHLPLRLFTYFIDHHVRPGNAVSVVYITYEAEAEIITRGFPATFERQRPGAEVRMVVDSRGEGTGAGLEWLRELIEERGEVMLAPAGIRFRVGVELSEGTKVLEVMGMVLKDRETEVMHQLRVGEGVEEGGGEDEEGGREELKEVEVVSRAQWEMQEM